MALTDYTTTASVRAILGVSFKEIEDEVLLDPVYAIRLSEDLLAIHADLAADYVITQAIDPKDAPQQRFVDLVNAYSAYQVASQCLGSVRMFAPKTIKDSRSELTRDGDPYRDLRGDIMSTLLYLRNLLKNAYLIINPGAVFPAATDRILVVSVPLGVDPVTG